MKTIYLKFLQWLCKKEIRRIADKYPNSLDDLIKYHDFMAIACLDSEAKSADRILGISVSTAQMLDKLKTYEVK